MSTIYLPSQARIYTVLKIDEVSNLGAARIRIRSLISAVNSRHEQHYKTCPSSSAINRIEFTKEMKEGLYSFFAPQMSPIHFDLLAPAFKCMGINIEILPDATKETIDVGLKYVNNDACYPSLIVVGQMMSAITSGKYERGERLPSVRELSVQLGVNYNTINKVYQDLERDGYIFTKRGRGTYVSDLKDVDLSAVGQDVEALAIDFVQQALAKGLTSEDIHDLVSEQILLLGGGA